MYTNSVSVQVVQAGRSHVDSPINRVHLVKGICHDLAFGYIATCI